MSKMVGILIHMPWQNRGLLVKARLHFQLFMAIYVKTTVKVQPLYSILLNFGSVETWHVFKFNFLLEMLKTAWKGVKWIALVYVHFIQVLYFPFSGAKNKRQMHFFFKKRQRIELQMVMLIAGIWNECTSHILNALRCRKITCLHLCVELLRDASFI